MSRYKGKEKEGGEKGWREETKGWEGREGQGRKREDGSGKDRVA